MLDGSPHSRLALSISPIACPASARSKALAPFCPGSGVRDLAAIRLPAAHPATVRVMVVNAFAAPGRRTRWKRQRGRSVAQEAFILQLLGRRARTKPSDNADRMPRLFEASRQLCPRPPFAKARVPFAGTTPNHGRSGQAWQISLTVVLGIAHAGLRSQLALRPLESLLAVVARAVSHITISRDSSQNVAIGVPTPSKLPRFSHLPRTPLCNV